MKIATTIPEALKTLWKEKIFLKPRDVKTIEAELEKKGYNFIDKSLMIALKRTEFLTRRGVRGNYLYVQKHPYIEEKKNER